MHQVKTDTSKSAMGYKSQNGPQSLAERSITPKRDRSVKSSDKSSPSQINQVACNVPLFNKDGSKREKDSYTSPSSDDDDVDYSEPEEDSNQVKKSAEF